MVTCRSILLITGLLFSITANSYGADLAEVRVSQVVVKHPEIKAYISLLPADAELAEPVTEASITASIGSNPATVVSVVPFKDTQEGVATIFLVDISKSLTAKEFSGIRTALIEWVDSFSDNDTGAIIAFGESVTMIADYTNDQNALKEAIQSLSPTDNKTMLHQAIERALSMASVTGSGIPDRKVIFVLSDGKDEGSGITIDDLVVTFKDANTPIYSIGFSRLGANEKRKYLDVMHRISLKSEGTYIETTNADFSEYFQTIRDSINKALVVKLECPDCIADGAEKFMRLTVNIDEKQYDPGVNIRILPPQPTPEPVPVAEDSSSLWMYIGIALILTLIALWLFRGKKKEALEESLDINKANIGSNGTQLDQGGDLVEKGIEIDLLVMQDRKSDGRRIRVTKTAIIGRGEQCDVVVIDDEVSTQHCAITLMQGEAMFQDLESMNGTIVNGVKLTGYVKVQVGDVVELGQTRIRIEEIVR